MRVFIAVSTIALAAAVLLAPVSAVAGLGCGFRPFPPFGCKNPQPDCVCDSHNNCEWIWHCGN